MKHIAIISASIREGRLSHRVALFMKAYIEENNIATVEILDLKDYNFPLFTERLVFQKSPEKRVVDFAERIDKADGIIIVSPVYNASFPASLKNVVDLLIREWEGKVIAVSSATYGPTQGIATAQAITSLMLKMGAWVVPSSYMATNVGTEYDEAGNPVDKAKAGKRIKPLLDQMTFLFNKKDELI